MEGEAVRRRVNTISGHFAIVSEDVTAATSHLLPLNCSSNLSTPFTRFDNKLTFARQASSSHGPYMRQTVTSTSTEENCSSNLSTPFTRFDNRLTFARQASSSQGPYMRQGTSTPTEEGKLIQQGRVCSTKENYIIAEKSPISSSPLFAKPGSAEPMFMRPSEVEFNCSNAGIIEGLKTNKMSQYPKFSRPREETSEIKQFRPETVSPQINGFKWSPRINVAESKSNHVITVELPGVDVNDIRVEMDEKNIIVRGKRAMKLWKAAGSYNDSCATYHRREISQGPYQVVWPIPPGSNKDSVAAEFIEGILQITVPKLREC